MQFYTLSAVLALFALGAQAQLEAIPTCAMSCLTGNLGSTGCSITDFQCSCSNTDFIAASTTCVESSCEADDIEKAKAATSQLCADAGVPISVKKMRFRRY